MTCADRVLLIWHCAWTK